MIGVTPHMIITIITAIIIRRSISITGMLMTITIPQQALKMTRPRGERGGSSVRSLDPIILDLKKS